MRLLCRIGWHSWITNYFYLERRCKFCGQDEHVPDSSPYGTVTLPIGWIVGKRKKYQRRT